MKKYACNFLYKYSESEMLALLTNALDVLGFEPTYMAIFFNEFEKPLDDITYDKKYLFEILKSAPISITLKSQLYDEGKRETNNWFRIKLYLDRPYDSDSCSFEWNNTNLDFLIDSDKFSVFLSSPNLVYAYCYDQYDCMNQSNNRIDSFVLEHPNKSYKIAKDHLNDDVIDVSKHWGRYVNTLEFTFMAAPLMWFGEDYFKIIPKEKLLKFKGAILINHFSFDLVHIQLFALYDDPSMIKNRERQQMFWETFDLEKKAVQYEEDRPFDFIKWYKEKAAKKKRKRK